MPHFMMVYKTPYTNLLNLAWIKKMSIFEEYGAFNRTEQNFISLRLYNTIHEAFKH